jgi:hypothetical protein
MERHEFLRLNAALATAPDRFCVSFDEGDPDDPFSIVLTYDGRLPQPWGRTDIRRLIRSIAVYPADPETFVVMSDEGDVYFLLPDRTVHEKIPGSGIYSRDATGRGPMHDLLPLGETLAAFGNGSQAYVRVGAGSWQWLTPGGVEVEPGYLGYDCLKAAVLGNGILCLGNSRAETVHMTEEMGRQVEEAGRQGNMDEVNRIFDLVGAMQRPDMFSVRLFQAGQWSHVPMPLDVSLRGIFVERPDLVWLVGLQGAIFKGNAEDGFQEVGFRGDTEDLYAITRFGKDMVLASGYSLHRFDGHVLWPLKPRLDAAINGGVPTPLKLQTVGDVMFYFDYKHGVCRWDCETWHWIDFPPGLLDREFKGFTTP